jgi:hypothetical protein
MSKLYIHINKNWFERNKNLAETTSKEGDNEDGYLWENLNFNIDSIEIDNGNVFIGGSSDLGYISLDFNLDMDTAIDVIEFYMKKLGKLKTILEATK